MHDKLTRRQMIGVFTATGLATVSGYSFAATANEPDPELEGKLLALDALRLTPIRTVEGKPKVSAAWTRAWHEVLRLCDKKNEPRAGHVVRGVAGHARLALNDNRRSLEFLLTLSDRPWRTFGRPAAVWRKCAGPRNAARKVR